MAVDGVNDCDLAENGRGKSAEIYRVNAAIDEPVAHESEKNQDVDAGIKENRRPHVGRNREASEGRRGQGAGGNEHQAAVKFGTLSPYHCQGERDAEGNDVVERDQERQIGIARMVMEDVEAGHCYGRPYADHERCRAERNAKPTQHAMRADAAGLNQCRLHDEKRYPSREECGVEVEDEGTRNIGVNEFLVDGPAEARRYDTGDQETHQQIKVATEENGDSGLMWRGHLAHILGGL